MLAPFHDTLTVLSWAKAEWNLAARIERRPHKPFGWYSFSCSLQINEKNKSLGKHWQYTVAVFCLHVLFTSFPAFSSLGCSSAGCLYLRILQTRSVSCLRCSQPTWLPLWGISRQNHGRHLGIPYSCKSEHFLTVPQLLVLVSLRVHQLLIVNIIAYFLCCFVGANWFFLSIQPLLLDESLLQLKQSAFKECRSTAWQMFPVPKGPLSESITWLNMDKHSGWPYICFLG